MNRYFGDLVVNRYNTYTFLGMNITITDDKKIIVEMKDQLMEATYTFSLGDVINVNELVTLPAQKNLRLVDD